MSIAPHTSAFNAFVAPPPIAMKQWTVEEYHELIKLGMLTENDPYELIEGWLVRKMTKGPRHNSAVRMLNRLFRKLPPPWFADCQNSLTLSDGEPEPDVAVVRGPEERFRDVNVTAADTAIVVESSDSSLSFDRTIKLRTYARAGVPEYWVVNVVDQQIEVYTKPTLKGDVAEYANRVDYLLGQSVPVVLDGKLVMSIAVAEVVGFGDEADS
jgi:Uma2 family endonuclease